MAHKKPRRKKQKHRRGHGHKRDNHHVYPRSRKKIGDLDKFKPLLRSLRLRKIIKSHNAWHHLFINLFPEESLSSIKKAFKNGNNSAEEIISFIKRNACSSRAITKATKEDMNAWREIFNSYWSWRKIKKVIQKEWMYPGIKTIISKGKVFGVMVFLKNIPKIARIVDGIHRCKDIRIISLKNGELLKIT